MLQSSKIQKIFSEDNQKLRKTWGVWNVQFCMQIYSAAGRIYRIVGLKKLDNGTKQLKVKFWKLSEIQKRYYDLTSPKLARVKMTDRTTYLRTKSKLYILNSSNSLNFHKFQIEFRKNFCWTSAFTMVSSFLISWSVPYKMTQH